MRSCEKGQGVKVASRLATSGAQGRAGVLEGSGGFFRGGSCGSGRPCGTSEKFRDTIAVWKGGERAEGVWVAGAVKI